MRRQRVTTLEQIERVGKRKAPAFEEPMVEPKQARALSQHPQELAWAPAHTVAWLPPQPMKLMSRASTSRSIHTDPTPAHRVQELDIPAEPLAKLSLEASDQIMSDALAVQQEQRSKAPQAPVASSSKARASSQGGAQVVPELPAPRVQSAVAESHRLSVFVPAPDVPGPSKHHQGRKPQADTSKMDIVNFPSNVPAQAGPGQLLFQRAMVIPAPPPQLTVVVVTTDSRTPEQYDGLIVTQQKAAAVSKGKRKVVPMLSDKSDYGESSSKHKQESEEGESVAQRFQHMQYNKKLAAKKASKAKAEAALQHRAINDFSGRIPDGLGVKVWGPLDVEQLNSCFTGALSDCVYYSVHNNTIFVRADANRAVAFKYSSRQRAKMPTSLVYKFVLCGFPRTLYELERLYKHYANKHAPHRDRVVTYLLMNELLLVAQKLNESLLARTMQALLYDPIYRDLQSPIWGKEDMDFVIPRHIPTCFMCVKEDGTTVLHVMRAPDPSQPFDLEQIVQYVLIFGWPGLENTWQGIAFDFAYRMHWQTLFGFTLCRALCTTSTAKSTVVRRLALVMARPGMYWEAVASYNAAFLDQLMVAQYRSHLNLMQVHMPDEMA
ncbi:hypothetical protein C0995_009647 [Termitomyces sp. Mi166|nr:hypothetical protein C0995_009647 [Termitomyces sp. Mi166\